MVVSAISRVRVPAMPGEYDLHSMIAAALDGAEIPYEHEFRLAPRCRLDFMCAGVAVEVKKGRPDGRELVRQLTRYMEKDEVREMLVVGGGFFSWIMNGAINLMWNFFLHLV